MQRFAQTRLSALSVALMTLAVARTGSAQTAVHVVDDRGEPIKSPLTVCFQLALTTDCRAAAVVESLTLPASFSTLTVEGEDYGPLTFHREQSKAPSDRALRIVVPRKAELRIAAPARRQPLTVSLYSPQDASFRAPPFRRQLPAGEDRLRVPAGTFILSLSMSGDAPDLQALAARPAESVRVTYHHREGWSLLVRCVDDAGGRALGRVRVTLSAAVGFGQADRALAEAISGHDGLVLFSGVGSGLAALSASHTGLLAVHASGLTAARGTFAFRELRLPSGGRVKAQVTLHGRVMPEVRCSVSSPAAIPTRSVSYQELWNGNTDAKGTCVSGPLAAGRYRLTLKLPDRGAQVERWVSIQEAQVMDEDVAFAATHVKGVVKKGGRPVSQYSVKVRQIVWDRPSGSRAEVAAAGITDEDGRYELTVWSPGDYLFELASPSARIPGTRQLHAAGDDDQTIDFELAASTLEGTVVDEEGKPVAEASVIVNGWDTLQIVPTGDGGGFSIDLPRPGGAEVEARKRGYRSSDSVHFQIGNDLPVTPLTLVLKRATSGQGTVVSAAGSPVAAALVTSVMTTPDGPKAYSVTRSEADGSFRIDLPPGPSRALVSGPGCPLFMADLSASAASGNAEDAGGAATVARCPEESGTIELTLQDDIGKPVPHTRVILRWNGVIIPDEALALHLQALGLSPETDGAGHLVIAGISPGAYDLFVASLASEAMIAAGSQRGYVTSLDLPPLDDAELQLTLPRPPAP